VSHTARPKSNATTRTYDMSNNQIFGFGALMKCRDDCIGGLRAASPSGSLGPNHTRRFGKRAESKSTINARKALFVLQIRTCVVEYRAFGAPFRIKLRTLILLKYLSNFFARRD
jgi:hypothetical protein